MTETIRGRVEPSLKKRVLERAEKEDRSESYLVRKAVLELMERTPAKAE